MPEQAYESIRLDSRPSPPRDRDNRRDSLDSANSGDSEVSYRDNLDVEPFDEKVGSGGDARYTDEPVMEDGEGGFSMQPRRVSLGLSVGESHKKLTKGWVAPDQAEVERNIGGLDMYGDSRGTYRIFGWMELFCTIILDQRRKSTYHLGPHIQWYL